jgi:hypothetical protein
MTSKFTNQFELSFDVGTKFELLCGTILGDPCYKGHPTPMHEH